MARPRKSAKTVKITRHIHPAIAERMSELESLGYGLEEMILATEALVWVLATTPPTDKPRENAYMAGWVDQASMTLYHSREWKERVKSTWRARRPPDQERFSLLEKRRSWIEALVSRHAEPPATSARIHPQITDK